MAKVTSTAVISGGRLYRDFAAVLEELRGSCNQCA